MIIFKGARVGIFCASLILACCAGLPYSRHQEQAATSLWSRWVEVGGIRVHYLDTDPAGPAEALLLVHGFLGSTMPFVPFIECLQPQRRIVMPDLPGCGLSSPPAGAGDMEFYLAFLREFSLQTGLGRLVLVGSSLWCQICVRYALRYPEQVGALVLCSPYGLAGQVRDRTHLARCEALLRLAAPFVSRKRLYRELRKAVADEILITPQVLDSYWRNLRTQTGRRVASQMLSRIACRELLEPVLPLVTQPVLILIGERDPLSSPQYIGCFQELAPGSRVILLSGAGHLPYLQAPEEMAQQIDAFLLGGARRVDSSRGCFYDPGL